MRDTPHRVWHSSGGRRNVYGGRAEQTPIRLGAYCAVEITDRKWARPALTDTYFRGVLFEKNVSEKLAHV
jgi:hypothetical protein